MTVYLVHPDATLTPLDVTYSDHRGCYEWGPFYRGDTPRAVAEAYARDLADEGKPVAAVADTEADAREMARLVAERNDLDAQTSLVRAILSTAATPESIAHDAQELARMGRVNLAQRLCDLATAERAATTPIAEGVPNGGLWACAYDAGHGAVDVVAYLMRGRLPLLDRCRLAGRWQGGRWVHRTGDLSPVVLTLVEEWVRKETGR